MKRLLMEIRVLFYKDLILEWRLKYAFNSILLFTGSTIFICYLGFYRIIDKLTWNALFWIIVLFAAVNSIAKSFVQEGEERLLYYYFIVKPQAIIISKIFYNTLLLSMITGLGYVLYVMVLGNPVVNDVLFLESLALGVFGLAVPLTLVAAIASKAGENPILMAILSFPIVVPVLVMCMKLSRAAIEGLDTSVGYSEVITLLAIEAIVFTLSIILYPYLWRS